MTEICAIVDVGRDGIGAGSDTGTTLGMTTGSTARPELHEPVGQKAAHRDGARCVSREWPVAAMGTTPGYLTSLRSLAARYSSECSVTTYGMP